MLHGFFQRYDVMGGQTMWHEFTSSQAKPAQVQISRVHILSCSFPKCGVSEALRPGILSVRLRFHRAVEIHRMDSPAPLTRLLHFVTSGYKNTATGTPMTVWILEKGTLLRPLRHWDSDPKNAQFEPFYQA